MKKIKTIITILSFLVSASVFAKIDYYIDPEILKYENIRNQKLKELHKEYGCKQGGSYSCFEKSSAELNMIYPARGIGYARKNYSNFTESQAYAKLAELAKLYEKLPVTVAGKPPLGVIKKSAIEAEAWYLIRDIIKVEEKRSRDLMVKHNNHILMQPFLDKNLNVLTKLVKR